MALVDLIADTIIERQQEALREAVAEALADALPRREQTSAGEIYGIDPHKLYTVAFVADRLSYDEAYVRSISAGVEPRLPRADWQGGDIRFRGVDILRYMGVPEEELAPTNITRLLPQPDRHTPDRATDPDRLPDPDQPVIRTTAAAHGARRRGGRPYSTDLPEL